MEVAPVGKVVVNMGVSYFVAEKSGIVDAWRVAKLMPDIVADTVWRTCRACNCLKKRGGVGVLIAENYSA